MIKTMAKLRDAEADDLVTVIFGSNHVAVAEAQELTTAGFGGRAAARGCLGEWTLLARSHSDFLLIARAIPPEYLLCCG